jgi:hypothetical protein
VTNFPALTGVGVPNNWQGCGSGGQTHAQQLYFVAKCNSATSRTSSATTQIITKKIYETLQNFILIFYKQMSRTASKFPKIPLPRVPKIQQNPQKASKEPRIHRTDKNAKELVS